MANNLRNLTAALLAIIVTGACTKKDPNRIDFESPLQFTYEVSLTKGENIAQVDGEAITASQLFSPSPALQELEMRMNKLVYTMAYEKALAQAGDSNVTLTFGFPATEGEDAKKIMGEKYSDKVEVAHDEALGRGIYKINDTAHSAAEFQANNRLLAQLSADSFVQKMQSLEGIVARRKILAAAKTANLPMEEYIQKTVLVNTPAITDQDVVEYGKKNNISESELTDELRAQLKDIIKGRRRDQMIADYVGKNLMKDPIKVGFNKPATRIELPSVGEAAPNKGEGPIEIVLFSYMQCAECQEVTQTMSEFVSSNPKYYKLNYVFNFPENNNEERMVSEASLCLKKQNSDFFWKFPLVLKKDESLALEESINTAVKTVGADFEKFRSCFLAREFQKDVQSHLDGTKTLNFFKSPVVVLDGIVFEKPSSNDLIDRAQAIKAEKGLGFNLFYNLKQMFFGK